MLPRCLHAESCFSSEAGGVETLEVAKTLRPGATPAERKPAIPPDDGASLNLLAERCSKVSGGVLETQDTLIK